MIVSLEHVFKYYGADCILRDVNAAINEKDRIGLVGANGEGKTTLLNVLTGGLDYEEGSVSLTNGKVIGYLHQNSGLSNGRTIQQEMEAVFADLIALGTGGGRAAKTDGAGPRQPTGVRARLCRISEKAGPL